MTTQKFNEAYVNANKLEKGSKFNYVGGVYSVTGFTKDSIITEGPKGIEKIRVYNFEGYIYYGFLQIL